MMRKWLAILLVFAAFVFSCKKEEEPPQTQPWDEDWCVFTATMINVSGDTSHIGFSRNQGYSCGARMWTATSLMPWEDQAIYGAQVNGQSGAEVQRGTLFFNGTTIFDRPEDSAFVNYFRSGYYAFSEDMEDGFNLIYTDPEGWSYSTSEYLEYFMGMDDYTCLLSDSHPFTRNGVQYVKVRMHFDNIRLSGPMGSITLLDADFEGYFKND